MIAPPKVNVLVSNQVIGVVEHPGGHLISPSTNSGNDVEIPSLNIHFSVVSPYSITKIIHSQNIHFSVASPYSL